MCGLLFNKTNSHLHLGFECGISGLHFPEEGHHTLQCPGKACLAYHRDHPIEMVREWECGSCPQNSHIQYSFHGTGKFLL